MTPKQSQHSCITPWWPAVSVKSAYVTGHEFWSGSLNYRKVKSRFWLPICNYLCWPMTVHVYHGWHTVSSSLVLSDLSLQRKKILWCIFGQFKHVGVKPFCWSHKSAVHLMQYRFVYVPLWQYALIHFFVNCTHGATWRYQLFI